MAKKTPKKFLAELASDAEKLGRFILDPEGVMKEDKFGKQDQEKIRNAVAHYVHGKMYKPPDADAIF
jgi:hypothetical protein